MYINRTVENAIHKLGQSFPCIVIYGARQVGKSTTIHHIFGSEYTNVTLDDLDDRNLALTNPKLFLETYGWPLIIDEIQKAPLLLDEIKKQIDQARLKWLDNDEPRQLMYILTGSNRFELQQGIADSLAGRCGILEMTSFSQAEKQHSLGTLFYPDISMLLKREKELKLPYKSRKEIFENIFTGGMPDICTNVVEREPYFKSYVNTYIEKDVRKLISADSELPFRNFISLLALRTAQEFHVGELANAVGIDTRTCKKWISVLETSGIIYLLQPYMAKISKRIIKAPKIYFLDTGLCSYLCKWPNAEMLESCAMSGAFFETFVVSEMIKNAYAYNLDPHSFLFYYQDIDQKEVDIIYTEQGKIYPIEIKKGVAPNKPTKNFSVLKKYDQAIQPGLVIDTCDKIRPINEEAWTYPVYILGF